MNDGQKRCEGKSDGKKIRVTVTVAKKKSIHKFYPMVLMNGEKSCISVCLWRA